MKRNIEKLYILEGSPEIFLSEIQSYFDFFSIEGMFPFLVTNCKEFR